MKQICAPCAAVRRAQGDEAAKLPTDALQDQQWAVGDRGINVRRWLAAHPERRPGLDVTILQIDTGITAHPLVPEFVKGKGGVDRHAADGLFGPGSSNDDPLLSGFLRFPGHGTKTSSVITMDAALGSGQPVGAAPGARVIPVRGTQGVVLFPRKIGELEAETWRISRALLEAANTRLGNKSVLKTRVDVISMSLGGFPQSDNICEAVTKATEAGIIVIAAAGNQVRRTKYPARCANTMAIAGSTIAQQPWKGSAGSEQVTVAAPAEAVWTAANVNGSFCLDASSGTSFATALVAGMAAEWLSFVMARDKLQVPPPDAPKRFRAAVAATARKWTGSDAEKWTRKFGAGVADLSNLMEAEARAVTPRAGGTLP